jgi:hypothetical protein
MTTPEQKLYNHTYPGVPHGVLQQIVQDVRDWDNAYSNEGKIERSLRKIEKHQESLVAWTKKGVEDSNRPSPTGNFLRERAVAAAELRVLLDAGVDPTIVGETKAYRDILRRHIERGS